MINNNIRNNFILLVNKRITFCGEIEKNYYSYISITHNTLLNLQNIVIQFSQKYVLKGKTKNIEFKNNFFTYYKILQFIIN